MHLLVNYEQREANYLPVLAALLRQAGHTAVSTSKPHSATQLMAKAKAGKCEAIICINSETLANLAPGSKPSLDAYRGSLLRYDYPVLVVNPLAHINSVTYGRFLLENDLKKLSTCHLPPAHFSFEVVDTEDKFEEILSYVQNEAILMSHDIETITLNQPKKKERKAINDDYSEDVEGLGGDTIISCAGWSILSRSGAIRNVVLPLVDFAVDHYLTDLEYQKALLFLRAMNAVSIDKVMHNGMYDALHCLRYHAPVRNWTLDTMAMQHFEYVELPKTLDFTASLHLPDYIYWKDLSDSASKAKDVRSYWRYNALDCFNTLRIAMSWLRNAPAYARKNYADGFKLVYPALYCSFEGFQIDQEERERMRRKATSLRDSSLALLRTYVADPEFNPGSWQQVEKYIYNVFGAKKPKIGKSKSCTDEKNLKAVAEQHPLLALLVEEILTYRENVKAIGTYFDFLQMNGRLLWSLDPFGTETERMACRASSLWCGTQVQNIPSYAKSMLIADEGFLLGEADNSQSEARCTAYCAQEEKLIAALEAEGKDFYKTLAFLFFGIPYEEVTDFMRNKVIKKIVHGTNYMMGAKTFIENVGIAILHEAAAMLGFKLISSTEKASKKKLADNEITIMRFATILLDKYHEPFPRVRKWYEELLIEVIRTGMVKSPLGHTRRIFTDLSKNKAALKEVVAHQPQNLSVTIINKGFWNCYYHLVTRPQAPLKLGDYRLKAQIHDSILDQFREEFKDVVLARKHQLMDNPTVIRGRTLRIPVDHKVGRRWAERKENKDGTIENEDGCVKVKLD